MWDEAELAVACLCVCAGCGFLSLSQEVLESLGALVHIFTGLVVALLCCSENTGALYICLIA